MDEVHFIWCGPDPASSEKKRNHPNLICLNTHPINGNVRLKLENIQVKLARNLTSMAKDLLEIGGYVYSADQSVSRGGLTWKEDGKYWRRNFHFDIQVRNPDFWNKAEVKESLSEALAFLSDDNYEFSFRKLTNDIPSDDYIEYDDGKPWFDAKEILLFSSGLDSLAGMIHEAIDQKKKVILVSHRSVPKISKRQVNLLEKFDEICPIENSYYHIPVWVNKASALTKDTNQRTRSFLYATLAAVIARMQNLNTIKFYENGIVSMNLPISPQLIGARASRSTHPKALALMSKFFSGVFKTEFKVENPFLWKTKSDVVKIVKDHKMSELIAYSVSCSHVRTTDAVVDHCGTCSQCIDRRIAVLQNSIDDEFDEEYRYNTKLFTDPLKNTEDRTMVESYISHATELEGISISNFFQKYPQALDIVQYCGESSQKAAANIFDLHKRHGKQVCKVVEAQIEQNSELIRRKKVNPSSLLAMIIKQPGPKSAKESDLKAFPTPADTKWEDITIEIVSNDSARIKVGGITKTCTAFDMGFRDHRKGDLPNKQWEVLKLFADCHGKLSWDSGKAKPGIQKHVQLLRNALKAFFCLSNNPIIGYRKESGYVTKFRIFDKSFGRKTKIRRTSNHRPSSL